MEKARRAAVIMFTVFVLFALTASLFVSAIEADHDCTGENCPVCAVIAVCENILKTLCGVMIAAAVSACFHFALSIASSVRFTSYDETPISLKVKLLN